MIKIENTEVVGWEHAIRGMRNPKNSWDRMDSFMCREVDEGECPENCTYHLTQQCPIYDEEDFYVIGPNDHKLMMQLANGGPVHAKYRRMIAVYADITAPLFWWKEYDTYKIGTVRNSCSTMHKIHVKEFTYDDFAHEGIDEVSEEHPALKKLFGNHIWALEWLRKKFNETQDKKYWRALIEMLPDGYMMKATIMTNYEVLVGMYRDRKNHKLDEWHDFCDWITELPYSEIITGPAILEKKTVLPEKDEE